MRVSHPNERSARRAEEPNVIQRQQERLRKRPTYKCRRCQHGPLRDDGTKRAIAKLCLGCWFELHETLKCHCDAIQGKPGGVYLCDICPLYTGAYAKTLRDKKLKSLDKEH